MSYSSGQVAFNTTTAQTLASGDGKDDLHASYLCIRNLSGGSLEYQLVDSAGTVWLDVNVDPTKNAAFVVGLGFRLLNSQLPIKIKTPTAGSSTALLTYELAATYNDPTAP